MELVPVPRRILLAGVGLAAGAVLGRSRPAQAAPPDPLRRLLAGNERFVTGAPARVRRTPPAVAPFAVVLSCSDSRVAADVLFDQDTGDLVDVRVAGHAADEMVLGSVEFAVTEFAPSLLLVVGHEGCGAVALTVAAIRRDTAPAGNLAAVVAALRPAVEPALRAPGDAVDNGVRANVAWQIRALWERSGLVRHRVGAGALTVVGLRQDRRTGAVTTLTRGWR